MVYVYIYISWLKYIIIKMIKVCYTYTYIYIYTWLWNHIIRSELFRDNHRNIFGRWFDANHARFPWKPWWHLLVIRKDLRIKSQWISLEIGRPLNARKSLNMILKCIMIYIYIYICVCVCFEYCSFSPGNRQSTSKSFHSNHGLSSHNHRTPKHAVSGAFNSSHKSNISIKYDRSSGAEPELKWLVDVAGWIPFRTYPLVN